MFVVEENRPNNWVQTFNIGAGKVRHPSVAVREAYAQEYDLHFQDIDSTLNNIIQTTNDPRLIEKAMNREYNITQRRANYFLLNGRSFPFTLRDTPIGSWSQTSTLSYACCPAEKKGCLCIVMATK